MKRLYGVMVRKYMASIVDGTIVLSKGIMTKRIVMSEIKELVAVGTTFIFVLENSKNIEVRFANLEIVPELLKKLNDNGVHIEIAPL